MNCCNELLIKVVLLGTETQQYQRVISTTRPNESIWKLVTWLLRKYYAILRCYWYQILCNPKFSRNILPSICLSCSGVTPNVQDYSPGLDMEGECDFPKTGLVILPLRLKTIFHEYYKWDGQASNTLLGNWTPYSESVISPTLS